MTGTAVVPVVLLAFNRPDVTARVMARLRATQPRRLLVSVDGPRESVATDQENVERVRRLVTDIDWPCELTTRFAERNLGCREGVPAGLDWAFGLVDRAVVLEDDCLPDPSFFPFCAELLDRYADEPRVVGIGGHRWEGPDLPDGASYYFSSYTSSWGWATWADRWRRFDLGMTDWSSLRATPWLTDRLRDPISAAHWMRTFDAMATGLDTWDYAWQFACWRDDGLFVRPTVGMVANIGFGSDATHTTAVDPSLRQRPMSATRFPLTHPTSMTVDHTADTMIEWVSHSGIEIRRLREAARRIAHRRAQRSPAAALPEGSS